MRLGHVPIILPLAIFAMNATAGPVDYPETASDATIEEHFGERILDPYRWLENDVRTDRRVADWVEAENRVTQSYLATLPGRGAIEGRLKALWNYTRYGLPERRAGRYFYLRNEGLQNQATLYMQADLSAEPRLLIDPNGWAADGASALAEWEPSKDGRRIVYGVQDGGTDWRLLRVLDVDSGRLLPDEVRWAKFTGLAWARNGAGFFYSRFPEPEAGAEHQSLNLNHAIYFHVLGTAQTSDRVVYATPDRPKLNHVAEITEDGRWLVIYSSEGTDDRYEVTLIDLTSAKAERRTLVRGLENSWALVGSQGDLLYFRTNLDAPRERIVRIDVSSSSRPMIEIVPEDIATLDAATIAGDRLVLHYLVDAKSEVRIAALDGRPVGTVPLPGIGSAIVGKGEADSSELFFSFQSFAVPATIYRFDTAALAVAPFKQAKLGFDPATYAVSQLFYTSKDGTRVPIFVAHRKGLKAEGGAPTLLYGYGGFNISLPPAFSPANMAWMEMGGVFAVANIRGGGEYGKAWHEGGRLHAKQNVFDDFIAAAEFLIAKGITTKAKLAIEGRSNGGLLVGAVVNQRPDLFAAALPAVGVMDMLRFNRFTAGRYWIDDYGDPGKAEDFRVLRAYSPYHNIRSLDYPAILVTTADTDDRVVPGHSFKYAAALQAATIGSKPHLIRVESRAGHGMGKPTDKQIEEYADLWAFAAYWTGLALPGE